MPQLRAYYNCLLLAVLLTPVFFASELQIVGRAAIAYRAFHALSVMTEIVPQEGEAFVITHPAQDLGIAITLDNSSGRDSASSKIQIRYYEDVNYPYFPEKWQLKFERSISDRDRDLSSVRIPGHLYERFRPIHRVRLELSVESGIRSNWIGAKDKVVRTFFVAPYPKIGSQQIETASVLRLSLWAYARSRMLENSMKIFGGLMDPTYRIEEGRTPAQISLRFGKQVQDYLGRFFGELNFKPWLAEFISSYARGLEEKIEFPVEFNSFLNVPDLDFDLRSLLPATIGLTQGYPKNVENYKDFTALFRIIGLELDLARKITEAREEVSQGIELLYSFQNLRDQQEFVRQIALIKKNEEDKQRKFAAIGKDMKRILGWDEKNQTWTPLQRSPIFELANNAVFTNGRREFIEAQVIEAVRGMYFTLFFILAAEDYYSRVFVELSETALGIFQLSPPEITFELDREILLHSDPGVLIARVFNPSRYLTLQNVHLLMEKQNLRRLLFFRGDNVQTIPSLAPQSTAFVFFRFTATGIGTDHPRLRVRYNQDFTTTVQAIPVTIQRKDEFLNKAMEKVDAVVEDDSVNAYSRLRQKIQGLQDRLEQKSWEAREVDALKIPSENPWPLPEVMNQQTVRPSARPGR